ncbi:hypothetical protein K469DRAFT_753081 [Zopfia rhizophila CBS 207.26]|uniref:Uncharacterized protein n=1 Tax=Zopfia rhizophila CBS 207.26 TaxID=1314779 RepID=A0A6A6DP00_9PEZI|nr:hypothetical protein K469DRAFT_753081 [Zopfia rhizophila CBS 207.26]
MGIPCSHPPPLVEVNGPRSKILVPPNSTFSFDTSRRYGHRTPSPLPYYDLGCTHSHSHKPIYTPTYSPIPMSPPLTPRMPGRLRGGLRGGGPSLGGDGGLVREYFDRPTMGGGLGTGIDRPVGRGMGMGMHPGMGSRQNLTPGIGRGFGGSPKLAGKRQTHGPVPGGGTNAVPMGAHAANPNVRANAPVTPPLTPGARMNRGKPAGHGAGSQGQEWVKGDPFLDACFCTTGCTCRKGHRVVYRHRRDDGATEEGEIRYLAKDKIGTNCDGSEEHQHKCHNCECGETDGKGRGNGKERGRGGKSDAYECRKGRREQRQRDAGLNERIDGLEYGMNQLGAQIDHAAKAVAASARKGMRGYMDSRRGIRGPVIGGRHDMDGMSGIGGTGSMGGMNPGMDDMDPTMGGMDGMGGMGMRPRRGAAMNLRDPRSAAMRQGFPPMDDGMRKFADEFGPVDERMGQPPMPMYHMPPPRGGTRRGGIPGRTIIDPYGAGNHMGRGMRGGRRYGRPRRPLVDSEDDRTIMMAGGRGPGGRWGEFEDEDDQWEEIDDDTADPVQPRVNLLGPDRSGNRKGGGRPGMDRQYGAISQDRQGRRQPFVEDEGDEE